MDVVRLDLDFEGEKNLIRQGKKEIFLSKKFFFIFLQVIECIEINLAFGGASISRSGQWEELENHIHYEE